MRKSLGVAGLLALLVLPLTGSAGATIKPPPPKKTDTVCAWVKAAANVKAGANIGLFGTLMKKHPLDVHAKANVDGDVYVLVCVKVENVAIALDAEGLLKVGQSDKCKDGIDLRAVASLATGVVGGSVEVIVKVKVVAGGTLVTDPAKLDADALIEAFAKIDLAPFSKLDSEVLADLDLCVDLSAVAGVEVGGDDGDKQY